MHLERFWQRSMIDRAQQFAAFINVSAVSDINNVVYTVIIVNLTANRKHDKTFVHFTIVTNRSVSAQP
jgi:hypothetical protein